MAARRRTNKKKLAERLEDAAKKDPASINKEVLWEYYLDEKTRGEKTTTRDLWTEDQEWTWLAVPQVPGMVPWLIFLFGEKFIFDHNKEEIKESLEVHNCPTGCAQICLYKRSRVLVIYR